MRQQILLAIIYSVIQLIAIVLSIILEPKKRSEYTKGLRIGLTILNAAVLLTGAVGALLSYMGIIPYAAFMIFECIFFAIGLFNVLDVNARVKKKG